MTGPETSPNVEDLAAETLAVARTVATAVREDVFHRLAPQEQTGPERLLRMLNAREIFDAPVLGLLAQRNRCLHGLGAAARRERHRTLRDTGARGYGRGASQAQEG